MTFDSEGNTSYFDQVNNSEGPTRAQDESSPANYDGLPTSLDEIIAGMGFTDRNARSADAYDAPILGEGSFSDI